VLNLPFAGSFMVNGTNKHFREVAKSMKTRVSCIILLCSVAFYAGCAKQGIVKSEEPVMSQPIAKQIKTEPPKTVSVKAEPSVDKTLNKGSETKGALEPVPNAGELKIVLEKIYFDFDSAILSQGGPSDSCQ
jgi:hypothetical protein